MAKGRLQIRLSEDVQAILNEHGRSDMLNAKQAELVAGFHPDYASRPTRTQIIEEAVRMWNTSGHIVSRIGQSHWLGTQDIQTQSACDYCTEAGADLVGDKGQFHAACAEKLTHEWHAGVPAVVGCEGCHPEPEQQVKADRAERKQCAKHEWRLEDSIYKCTRCPKAMTGSPYGDAAATDKVQEAVGATGVIADGHGKATVETHPARPLHRKTVKPLPKPGKKA